MPIRPLPMVGSEVGALLKGLDQALKEMKKGHYAPLLPPRGRLSELKEIYIASTVNLVTRVTKIKPS